MQTHAFTPGQRVIVQLGPVEMPCRGCGALVGETQALGAGGTEREGVIDGPMRGMWRCRARLGKGRGRCNTRTLVPDGWYRVTIPGMRGYYALPWTRIYPVAERVAP